MKTWTLRFRKENKDDFDRLRSGIKSVETRAASPKYQPVETGDNLFFVCGKDKFSKIIKKKYHFKDIDSMLRKISFKKIGPKLKSKEELKKMYDSYPNYKEKIKKFGILAFELE